MGPYAVSPSGLVIDKSAGTTPLLSGRVVALRPGHETVKNFLELVAEHSFSTLMSSPSREWCVEGGSALTSCVPVSFFSQLLVSLS